MSSHIPDTSIDRERMARDRWWHEDELVNQRMTWFFAGEGVLGAGYAWVRYRIAELVYQAPAAADGFAQSIDPQKLEPYLNYLEHLSSGLLILGALLALFVLFGVNAAINAQTYLAGKYPQFDLGVAPQTTKIGSAVARSIPIIGLLAWSVAYFALHKG